MSNEIIYHVKGSVPDPYIVKVTISPLSISCTCQAAENGLPCKHRITILYGADPGIVEGDKSKLSAINKAAEAAGVFDLLKNYDNAKDERKIIDGKADKAFKKYRDARLELLQKRVKTDRAVVKARDEMESAIEALIPAADKIQATLKAIGGIFRYISVD